MSYKKLSALVEEFNQPQQSDKFVKRFYTAVREGVVQATRISERFTLPKEYSSRKEDSTYQRMSQEMVVEDSANLKAWLEETKEELSTAARRQQIKPTLESIEAGLVDFATLAEETRRKMQASYKKGQALGKRQAAARKKVTKPTRTAKK